MNYGHNLTGANIWNVKRKLFEQAKRGMRQSRVIKLGKDAEILVFG